MGNRLERLMDRKRQEDVRRTQEEAGRILRENRRKQRKEQEERDRILKKRAENELQWQKGKDHFYASGVLGIMQQAIDLGLAEGKYVDPESFRDELHYEESVGRPYFSAELHIKNTHEYDKDCWNSPLDKITTKYIMLQTDKEGTISFIGLRFSSNLGIGGMFLDVMFHRESIEVPIVAKVPKAKWEKDKGALEKALIRVYNHPFTSTCFKRQ